QPNRENLFSPGTYASLWSIDTIGRFCSGFRDSPGDDGVVRSDAKLERFRSSGVSHPRASHSAFSEPVALRAQRPISRRQAYGSVPSTTLVVRFAGGVPG